MAISDKFSRARADAVNNREGHGQRRSSDSVPVKMSSNVRPMSGMCARGVDDVVDEHWVGIQVFLLAFETLGWEGFSWYGS